MPRTTCFTKLRLKMNSALKDALFEVRPLIPLDSTVLVAHRSSHLHHQIDLQPDSRSFSAICTEIQCKENSQSGAGRAYICAGTTESLSIRFMD